MIASLDIKNFLTIKDSKILFSDNITCFTGESGSGKSVLASVLFFLFGEEIKTKISLKDVSITANIKSAVLAGHLRNSGFQIKEDFYLTREFKGNRSRFLINDKPIGKSDVRNIFLPYLITTHQNLNYLRNEVYIELLSDFDMSKYKFLFDKQAAVKKRYQEIGVKIAGDKEEYEKSKKLIERIKKLKPYRGEIEELRKKITGIRSAEKIKEIDGQINILLYGDGKLLEHLLLLKKLLIQKEELQGGDLSASVGDIIINFENGEFQADDITESGELEKIKKRLSDLRMLEFRMQQPLDEVMDNLTDMEKFVRKYDENCAELSDMKQDINQLHNKIVGLAGDIHDRRLRAALDIEKRLSEALKGLGIDCSIRFHFEKTDPNRFGTDKISLLFSSNPQIVPQEINLVASGGEKSRILLSLLTIKNKNKILILDEIDEGTSGSTTQKIASILRLISQHCQIVIITHKPQIAAVADIHCKVSKLTIDNQAVTTIRSLSVKQRVGELASLISTESSSEEARRYAEKLLKN